MSDKLAAQKATPHKTNANKHEITVDGVTYRACMHKIVYSIMNSSTSRKDRQLVDRGANGIVGGDDTRVLSMTDRTVDVEGIDRHQMTNIRIGTLCGFVQTNRGPAIAILNQAANTGRGQTILSCVQMEAFGVTVDDKSVKVGGKQCISTPDGFEIPLDIKNGLAYIKMRPPTDRELASDIPHVVLTSDADWDPTALDHSIDDVEQWASARPTDGPEEVERPFDNLGILKATKAVTNSRVDSDDSFESILDYFESFDQYLPTDGLYEASLEDSSLPTEEPDPLPPEFQVYEARRRPSVLFAPEPSLVFDIESAPLVPSKPTKASNKDDTQQKERHSSQSDNSNKTKPRPPPRIEHEDPPNDNGNTVYKNPSSAVKSRERDWERLRRHFAWLPKLVVQKTFDCTTQLARIPMSVHLQRHYKSPFPALNVNRRDEPVATDTVYADIPDIEHGHKAAQFFVGTISLVSDVYGVKTDAQFLQTLQDNVRRRGAMSKLVSDSATSEKSKAVQDYLRWLLIDDWQSEPYRQNQNPAERRYQDIKRLANRILDRTGAPDTLWLLAIKYASFVYNHSAVKSLNWKTPISVLTGTTPDISVLLRFAFYELVYYKNDEPSFPSESTESLGRIVGIAEHVGHALTYKILNPSTNNIIFRSEVRSAEQTDDVNKRLVPEDGESEPPQIVKSIKAPVIYSSGDSYSDPNAVVNNKDLIGRTFLLEPDSKGFVKRAKIVDLLDKHLHDTENRPEHRRFRVSVNNDEYENIMSYNEILARLEEDDDNPTMWKYKRISGHQGPLRSNHPSYMGSSYNVTIEWENGEITPEPLDVFAADDPVACAIYARDNKLLDKPGWKRFRRIVKNHKKLLRMANQAKLRSFRTAPKYMYGYEIPKHYADALRLDRLHGNTKWQDATKAEMDQLAEYKVFVDMGIGTPIPKGFQKIRVHLVFACKHDGRHKARLVADGHLTEVPVDSVYSGVVSIRGLKLMIFLAELNNLEVWGTDIGNAYLEAYTTEKVAIIAGPEFGPLEGHTLIVSRALYGLRMSGKMWHQRFATCLEEEGFYPCKAEPDIWMRPSADGSTYEYVGVYVDDLAMVMQNPKEFVDKLTNDYKFKLKGTGPIEFHLGCDFYRDEHGILCMHPRKYIDRMVDAYVRMFGKKPSTSVMSPLEKGDHPECDTSELLGLDSSP